MLERIEYDRTTTTGYFFRNLDGMVEHLNVEHPLELSGYIKVLPKLRSAKFDFSKSAYKKTFDQEAQLIHFLENTKLTRLEIVGSSKLTELPEVILQHPLRSLKITRCPNIASIAEILPHLEELVVLSIVGTSINLGERFPILPKLKNLSLNLKEVNSLKQLSLCYQLEELILTGVNLEALPEDISRLQRLKNIKLQQLDKLKVIPSFAGAENVENLDLMRLPAVDRMEIDFSKMHELQKLRIVQVGTQQSVFELPDNISQCKKLNQLSLAFTPITRLPDSLKSLSALEVFDIENLKLSEIPDIFENMPVLTVLYFSYSKKIIRLPRSIQHLKALKHFRIKGFSEIEKVALDFYPLENLESFTLENCAALKEIDASLAQNTSVKKISLLELPELKELPPLGRRNLKLEHLGMRSLPKFAKLPATLPALPVLDKLSGHNIGIESLPTNIDDLKKLSRLELYAENLSHLPPTIGNIKTFIRFALGTTFTKKDEKILTVYDLYPTLNKQTGDEVKRAIIYWIGNGYTVLPLTNELKENTFKALHWSVKNLHLIILSRIHFFNKENKKVVAEDLTKNKRIWINGTLAGNKTLFKNKLKELGLKVENKFSDKTEIVVVGRKPAIHEGIFNRPLQFVSQLEMEEIIKTENPGFLQKEDVPADFIHNLQQLLWSADPQNEAVALELVKANGLPEKVEEDFLLVAKICKDKNLKNRIRTFLKGRVSEAKQKAITIGSAPFSIEKLSRALPPESLAKMYYALFQRTKKPDPNFFRHDDGTHPGRAEMFQSLLPEFLNNYGYFKNRLPLLEEEYNIIFQQPGFAGKLKRIVINFTNCTKLPEALVTHVNSLKILELTTGEKFAIESIYPLKKINTLKMNSSVDHFPAGIGELVRLHTFWVSNKKPFTLPPDFRNLKKLKTLYFYGKLENREEVVEHFPHLLT